MRASANVKTIYMGLQGEKQTANPLERVEQLFSGFQTAGSRNP
jgi:hypothetical protein